MLEFCSLPGLTAYEQARAMQLDRVEKRAQDRIPDTVFFLEHLSVVTRGGGLQRNTAQTATHGGVRQMPLLSPLPPSIEYAQSERGGDLTYHGPGQLVIYPVIKLDGRGRIPDRDVSAYLRLLEDMVIDFLAQTSLKSFREPGATGVWVHSDRGGKKKIASIGIAVRRWVTYHGVAINLVNDLEPFRWISPCGFQPEVMTSLREQLGDQTPWTGPLWRQHAESFFRNAFQKLNTSPVIHDTVSG